MDLYVRNCFVISIKDIILLYPSIRYTHVCYKCTALYIYLLFIIIYFTYIVMNYIFYLTLYCIG